jgi:hypothetical protein
MLEILFGTGLICFGVWLIRNSIGGRVPVRLKQEDETHYHFHCRPEHAREVRELLRDEMDSDPKDADGTGHAIHAAPEVGGMAASRPRERPPIMVDPSKAETGPLPKMRKIS